MANPGNHFVYPAIDVSCDDMGNGRAFGRITHWDECLHYSCVWSLNLHFFWRALLLFLALVGAKSNTTKTLECICSHEKTRRICSLCNLLTHLLGCFSCRARVAQDETPACRWLHTDEGFADSRHCLVDHEYCFDALKQDDCPANHSAYCFYPSCSVDGLAARGWIVLCEHFGYVFVHSQWKYHLQRDANV